MRKEKKKELFLLHHMFRNSIDLKYSDRCVVSLFFRILGNYIFLCK